MKILITGGTGFVGQYIIPGFLNKNYQVIVLSRSSAKAKKTLPHACQAISKLDEIDKNEPLTGIINLAGESIDKKRWSKKQKNRIVQSRLKITQQCLDLIRRLNHKPDWMISGSAIGYYGPQDGLLDEQAQPQKGFTHDLCRQWESYAQQAHSEGVRVCLMRTGVVLGRGGGALKRLLPIFRLGLGGRLGKGQQWFSWIHQEDLRRIIHFMIEQESLSGPVNATSPNPVTNKQLTHVLAKTLKRPVFFPVPSFMVKLLFGEMGDQLLLKGQRVIPAKLIDHGFQFQYPKLEEALNDVIHAK